MLYHEMLRRDADVLLRETSACAQRERSVAAQLLVRLAAVEDRRLYAPPGYSSMWDYCLGELGLSDDAAARRLWAARKAREFPALFDALAEGRIRLTTIHLLATHLRADNVDELIAAASGRTKAELQEWLARRFPQPAVPTQIRGLGLGMLATKGAGGSLGGSPGGGLGDIDSGGDGSTTVLGSSGMVVSDGNTGPLESSHALARVPVLSSASVATEAQVPLRANSRVEPLNAEQVAVRFTITREVFAKLQRALELLGHRIAPNDVPAVFERALDALLPVLELEKFAATSRPRANAARSVRTPQGSSRARTIPLR